MTRENDIQLLCQIVIEKAESLISSNQGYDYCFFCRAEDGPWGLRHEPDCPIWIAKDLSARRQKGASDGRI